MVAKSLPNLLPTEVPLAGLVGHNHLLSDSCSATRPHPTNSPEEGVSHQGQPLLPSIHLFMQQTPIKPRWCKPCRGHGDGEDRAPVLRGHPVMGKETADSKIAI